MEMKSSEIYKYKAIEVKKLKEQKRWYDIICGCCSKDWDEVDVFITFQGILSTVNGAVSDFFLFTSDFKFEHGWAETQSDFGIILYSCHR